jgi:hypothetical protein
MTWLGRIRVRPVYLLVVQRVLSRASLNELDEIAKNIDKLVKQRDEIVSQIYKTMFFLATLLILVFLIEINLVTAATSLVPGVTLRYDQDLFVFGGLLIGNIVALLFSSAMVKMFVLEYLLATYNWLTYEGASRYISSVSSRFYVYIFESIADQIDSLPRSVTAIARAIHWMTVIILPITYICFYCYVLGHALLAFYSKKPSGVELFGASAEFWYLAVLLFFNGVTLSLYAFAFFPWFSCALGPRQLEKEVDERANVLWEQSGKPDERLADIRRLAERQIRLRYHMVQG